MGESGSLLVHQAQYPLTDTPPVPHEMFRYYYSPRCLVLPWVRVGVPEWGEPEFELPADYPG